MDSPRIVNRGCIWAEVLPMMRIHDGFLLQILLDSQAMLGLLFYDRGRSF